MFSKEVEGEMLKNRSQAKLAAENRLLETLNRELGASDQFFDFFQNSIVSR